MIELAHRVAGPSRLPPRRVLRTMAARDTGRLAQR
jgi:hypothetical protein